MWRASFTSATHSPANASLTYASPRPGPANGSSLVLWVDGTAWDPNTLFGPTGATAWGSGLGAYVQKVWTSASLRLTARYEIVANPETGMGADTMMAKFTVENLSAASVNIGLRLMIDTDVNNVDGANISVDNGFSTQTNNSYWQGSAVTNSWWGYDISPLMGTPNLVGHGSLWGNPFGIPATRPDVFEVAQFGHLVGATTWARAPLVFSITDSAVALWWTGTGSESSVNQFIAPGNSREFITYYGINAGALLATPTPVPTSTPVVPNMTVTKTLDKDVVMINDVITYCFNYTNPGVNPVTFNIWDTLPSQVDFVDCTGGCTNTMVGGNAYVVWGPLTTGAGASGSVCVRARVARQP